MTRMPSWRTAGVSGPTSGWQVSNASRLPSYQMTEPLREGGKAHVSGMPFRLDIVETGEQWVVTCATPHGKAVSRIPAPFSTDVMHRMLADIEKAAVARLRSHSDAGCMDRGPQPAGYGRNSYRHMNLSCPRQSDRACRFDHTPR